MVSSTSRWLAAAVLLPTVGLLPIRAENWPHWRGPRGDGASLEQGVPVAWSATSNIAWRVEVPGIGHSSPVIWGDRIFTLTALTDSQERAALCFSTVDGRMLWKQVVVAAPLEQKHALNSFASSTPATDGEQVYVTFLDVDQMVVAAYTLEGARRWLVRPGVFKSRHGFCSSPVLFQDKVIVNGDHDGDSYLVALSRKDGRTLWKTPRDNHTRSYCTPVIFEVAGRTQLVLTGDKSVASFDPRDGTRHWVIDGPTEQFVASVVYSPRVNFFFITGGFPDHHILAIRPDGSGNITSTHIAWRATKGAAYVPSPIIEGDYFLVVSDQGFATCYEAATGKLQWNERTGEEHASLVSAAGLVYFLNDEGVMNVVKPGSEFALVARNELGEKCFSSPAISEGRMYLRAESHLYCVGRPVK